MKAWLPEESTYVKIRIEPALQARLIKDSTKWLAFLYRQAFKALGGVPTAWRWELEGDTVVVGAAL